MPPAAAGSGAESPGEEPAAVPSTVDTLPSLGGARRPALWLLFVPVVLYVLAPLVANRVEPRVLGVPFLWAWVIGATIASPLVIWLVARLDPAHRLNAVEPLPADDRAAASSVRTEGEER
ncbi:DUF3311 domain-containing protein [Streptomyces sp. NPDC049954]|uniref:DUF3311 domain-containing protein n=1 Tax=Streptomyces sp. NPDC049954 TaxID=3155779 RepID=UPI00344960AF